MGSQSPRDENFIPHDFNELHADLDEGFDEGIGRGGVGGLGLIS